MKIACISDLHLSADEYSDSFQHKEDSFLHFLDYLEDHYDQIVLNGDIYDPWKSFWVDQHLDNLYKIHDKYNRLTKRFDQPNYLHIAGNHDDILENQLNYPTSHSFTGENGTKYFFAHGHEFDDLRGRGHFSILVTALVDWLEKVLWTNAEAYLSWLEERICSKFNMGSIHILRERAQEFFKAQDIFKQDKKQKRHVIVMGHSHERPVKVDFGNNIYLNCGACVRKRIEYVHIDTKNDEYFTQTWSETNRFGIATKTSYSFNNNQLVLN